MFIVIRSLLQHGLNACCFQSGGTTTISIDGNFGLVRKHHSGISPRPVSVTNGFFMDAGDVDTFVNSYSDAKEKDKVSSVFVLIKFCFLAHVCVHSDFLLMIIMCLY